MRGNMKNSKDHQTWLKTASPNSDPSSDRALAPTAQRLTPYAPTRGSGDVGGGKAADTLPGWEGVSGWTLPQQEALRMALETLPEGTANDPTTEFWARMERVAQRVPGKSPAECARAARAVAAARRGFAEAYYASAYYGSDAPDPIRPAAGGGGDGRHSSFTGA